MTKFDNVCWYSWIPPFAFIIIEMILAALEASQNAKVFFMVLFLASFASMVVMRSLLGTRVQRWKDEYQHLLNQK